MPQIHVGDPVPDLPFVDTHGARAGLRNDYFAGHRTVLVVAGAPRGALALELAGIGAARPRFEAAGARLAIWTAAAPEANAEVARTVGSRVMMLSDDGFALGRALGRAAGDPPLFVAIGPDSRLEGCFEGPGRLEAAIAHCEARAQAETPFPAPRHAPVLCVERILDPDLCARLIAFHAAATPTRGSVVSRDLGRNIVRTEAKIRLDVPLADDGPEADLVIDALARRVLGEAKRAFAFDITRCETLRLGRYSAAEGGRFRAHRDDVGQVRHRRFALSLNLNTGAYEGGGLRFPEYGPAVYAPPAGGGVLFSCALLHEAMPVTRGERFGLFGFFWGEAEEAQRAGAAARPARRIGPAEGA